MSISLFAYWMFLLLGLGIEDHDVPVANYQFTVEEELIVMELQFDKEDFETAIQLNYKQQVSKENTIKYFTFNTTFIINGSETESTICGFRTDAEHYYLDAELSVDVPIKELKVFSTSLVKEIENHSTILFIHEEGKEMRGFRLHKNRIHTTVEF